MTSASCPTADPSTSSSATRFSFNRTRTPIPRTSTKSTHSIPRSCSAFGTSGKTLSRGRASASWKSSNRLTRNSRRDERRASATSLFFSSTISWHWLIFFSLSFAISFSSLDMVGLEQQLYEWGTAARDRTGHLCKKLYFWNQKGQMTKVSSDQDLTAWTMEQPRRHIWIFSVQYLGEWGTPTEKYL